MQADRPRRRVIASIALGLLLLSSVGAAACTGVVIASDDHVWVGGNEDWVRFDSHMWAQAATQDTFGVVFLGYQIRGEWGQPYHYWYEFHGFNDQGLYFDSFGAPCVIPTTTLSNPYRGQHLMADAMRTCATVEEAVEVFESTNLTFMTCQQFLFVDKHGTAAVVEGDQTVWMEGDTFAITNFYLSDPSLGGHPCWRYQRATSMLEQDATPSGERIVELIDAASHPGTRYSVVCDLNESLLHIYYAGEFTEWATIDIAELCETGSARVPVLDLIRASD